MFEQFQVIKLNEALESHVSRLLPDEVSVRLEELLNSDEFSAKTVVIENDYIDIDYSASYYDQRGRSFTPDKRGTTRIHFFSEEFTKRTLTSLNQQAIRRMQRSYLGFAVLRPEMPASLGRTVISCPKAIGGYPVRFPTRGTVSVDLAGIELTVEACPYMSQDTKIMACATAALWMATSHLAEKVPGVTAHTTAEITAKAMSLDRPFGPVVGRRGLTFVEMEQALLQIGFDPRRQPYPTADMLIETCHLFSDSGIPPVLGIELPGMTHAVTVVGYALRYPVGQGFEGSSVISAHRFVPALIVHDDQRGMYLLAEVKDADNEDPWKAKLIIHTPSGVEEALCTAILVPFPRRVMLDAVEVQGQAEEWIAFAQTQHVIEARPVVYRRLLVKSNSYKQKLLNYHQTPMTIHGYSPDLVNFARSLPMPRFIWLIEVSYLDEWDPADALSPPVIADFILDSTATEPRRPNFLMAHFPGIVFGHLFDGGLKMIHNDVSSDGSHQPFPDVPRP